MAETNSLKYADTVTDAKDMVGKTSPLLLETADFLFS
jgi:hypothetical protein